MKVVLATHFFPPGHPGGTEAHTVRLARKLRERGHSPFVVCAEDWGVGESWKPRHEQTVYDGIPVRRLRWNWQLAPDPFVHVYDNPEVAGHFASYLRELLPDLVHVTSCYSLGAGIIEASREAGLPTVLTLTDYWFLCPRHTLQRGDGSLCEGPESALACAECLAYPSRAYQTLAGLVPKPAAARIVLAVGHHPRLARLRGFRGYVGDSQARLDYLRRAFDLVDVAISPSQFLIDVFGRNGFPTDRMHLVRHGLDADWLSDLRPREPGARLRLGYVGKIDPIKGVDVLVRAFVSLSGQVSAELRLYGDAEEAPDYTAELRRLASGNSEVAFMGPFERHQVASVFSSLDVVVVPSVWYENAPVSILEALGARKPVIATDLATTRELIEDGVSGILFPRGDEASLASAIRAVSESPGLLAKLVRGIKPVRTVDQEVEGILHLYDAALRGETAAFAGSL